FLLHVTSLALPSPQQTTSHPDRTPGLDCAPTNFHGVTHHKRAHMSYSRPQKPIRAPPGFQRADPITILLSIPVSTDSRCTPIPSASYTWTTVQLDQSR